MSIDATKLSLADADPIEQLLLDVEQRLRVVVTIHDRAAVFRDLSGEPMLALHRRRHRHPYCLLDRYTRPGWDENCLNHCLYGVNAGALRLAGPFTHVCWKGTQEVVVPILRDGVHLFTIFAGAFRPSDRRRAPGASAFPESVPRAYEQLPVSDEASLKSLARVLESVGYGLLHLRDQLQLADHTGDDRKVAVRRFFLRRAHQRVLLKDFARALSLSPSRASHLAHELFGVSFQEMLLQERIARAKVLLMSSTYSMNEIAKRVGIDNEYYFSRLFKKKVGIPPGRFRKENQKPITEGDE